MLYAFSTALVLLSVICHLSRGQKNASRPPVYGPWYLPPFIRGSIAMLRLAADEDAFLQALRQQYGPVVYIPWPLSQFFILDGDQVYSMPTTTLTFTPVRLWFQSSVFGTPYNVIRSRIMEQRIYPIHGKGLTNVRLDAPVQRFVQAMETKVAELADRVDAAGGTLEIGLGRWVIDSVFDAGASALFGEEFCTRASNSKLQEPFNAFDACFPLLASDMIPPALYAYVPSIAKGIKARDILTTALAEWVQDGMSALDEGIIRDVAETGPPDGLSTTEVATLLLIDLWALQANTTYAAASLLLYALQSPILPAILEEIDILASTPLHSGNHPPDDIKLHHPHEKPFTVPAPAGEFLIPGGSHVICATRAAHLSDAIWGEDPSPWEGDRFMERDGEETRSQKVQGMHGFGGGVSICEGRHLAAAELKSLLALALSAFHITPLYPTSADGRTPTTSPHTWFSVKGSTGSAIAPARAAGRAGMGVLQFGGADVIVRVTSRFT